HVVQAIPVGWEGTNGGRPLEAVLPGVFDRENPLPVVGHALAVRLQLVAPRILLAIESAARRELPFGLRGQALTRPAAIGHCVDPANVDHRVLFTPLDAAAGPFGMFPARSEAPLPPAEMPAEIIVVVRSKLLEKH